MIKILVILAPEVDFTLGQGIHAFLGKVKDYFNQQREWKGGVSITVIRALYTENAPSVQLKIEHMMDSQVFEDIWKIYKDFPGFKFSIPRLTLEVGRM